MLINFDHISEFRKEFSTFLIFLVQKNKEG